MQASEIAEEKKILIIFSVNLKIEVMPIMPSWFDQGKKNVASVSCLSRDLILPLPFLTCTFIRVFVVADGSGDY